MKKQKQLTVWLTGAGGQLGNAIVRNFGHVDGLKWLPTTRSVIDLTLPEEVERFFNFYKPDIVVNAAAFTGVDDAEINQKEAIRLNTELPAQLAELCQRYGKVLFHFSTDHVFGGENNPTRSVPYKENDKTCPANFYAKSKLEGEQKVLAKCTSAYVWRTAWLYSPYCKNFYNTIRRKAIEDKSLKVVSDEIGSPTSAVSLAEAIVEAIEKIIQGNPIPFGLYHCADIGETSRFDFAREILALDPETKDIPIEACRQDEYTTIATRPRYATLDIQKLHNLLPRALKPWKEALKDIYALELKMK